MGKNLGVGLNPMVWRHCAFPDKYNPKCLRSFNT